MSQREKVKIKLQSQQVEIRKNRKKKYKRNFRYRLLTNISQNDPFVNAGRGSHYGWALTVHKCIGSSFSKAIINVYQGENKGYY